MQGGDIGNAITVSTPKTSTVIYATGGSPGDINSDILAFADMVNIHVIAGSGSGGSLLANIIAGLDPLYETKASEVALELPAGGGGSILESGVGTSFIQTDNNIGDGPVDPGHAAGTYVDVVSAAGSMTWDHVWAGLENDGVTWGGNIDSDFIAGVPMGVTAPVSLNFDNATMQDLQDANDSITITNALRAGGVAGTPFGVLSNLNGILEAAGSINIGALDIYGNAVGNDGVAGRHIAAAGMGYKDAIIDAQNILSIGGGTVTGVLSGTFSAGLFVPANQAGPSPLNPNDLGPLKAGTVLTTGEVDIGTAGTPLTVGQWNQTATGNGIAGITLADLLNGSTLLPGQNTLTAESGTDAAYAPAFSIGATCNINMNIVVQGLPSLGNVNPDPATGNATNVSIASFGGIGNGDGAAGSLGNSYATVILTDMGLFNFVMSNIDAIIAFNTGGVVNAGGVMISGGLANPSAPSTLIPLQAGGIVTETTASGPVILGTDNNLNITAKGYGVGGLGVEFDTAGYDYFNQMNGGTFFASPADLLGSWGLGNLGGSLIASCNNFDSVTGGLPGDNLSFSFYGAGENVTGNLLAANNIASLSSPDDLTLIDAPDAFPGSPVASDDFYAMAGLSGLAALSPTTAPPCSPAGTTPAS